MSNANNQSPEEIEHWDEYWYEGALWVSMKAKDRDRRVGALVVKDGLIASSGFNGIARGLFDDPAILGDKDEKLNWICHAEANAIYNAARQGAPLAGGCIYVTKFPCLMCCSAILQAGIVRLYTQDEKYWLRDPLDDQQGSRKRSLLRQSRIEVVAPFHPHYATKKLGQRTFRSR